MDHEPTSLSDILNGEKPTPQPEPEGAPAPEPVAEAQPRDEHGRFAPKGEQQQEAPAEAAPGASPAPKDKPPLAEEDHPALIGERRRRQEAERQIEELTRQIEANRQPPAPAPSIWEDEQAALQHYGSQVVDQATAQASFNARLDMSEMLVRQQNPDFEEIKTRFLEMMRENPVLQQQALQDSHPWNFAYSYVKKADRMKELGAVDVADLEAKLREKIREELQAEAVAAVSGGAPSVPPTISGEKSAGSRSGPAWAGPVSLTDLIN